MAKRRHLGTIYENYPAKSFESWLLTILFKIIMMVVTAVIWLGIFWVGIAIIDFLQVNLLNDKPTPLIQMFQSLPGQMVYWGGVIASGLYILFSKVGTRKKDFAYRGEKYKGIYEANQ